VVDRSLAPLPKADVPRELATAAPLSRLDASPTIDRAIPAPSKILPSGELAASATAPLRPLEGATSIDRTIAPLARAGPTPDLPPAGSAPLGRIAGAPAVDRTFAPQGEFAAPGTAARAGPSAPSAGERLFAPGRDVFTPAEPAAPGTAPGAAPRLDLAATRSLAREINRAPPSRGKPLILLPPPAERESRLGRAIADAAQPDCRVAFAGLGLLAIPILLMEAVTDTGCRW
ncbi:MAG: hypothetical protein ABI886_11345, partial [Betaproteobacteria bacterium]